MAETDGIGRYKKFKRKDFEAFTQKVWLSSPTMNA